MGSHATESSGSPACPQVQDRDKALGGLGGLGDGLLSGKGLVCNPQHPM